MRPMPELKIETAKVADLLPYANNARIHTHEHVDQLADSISEVGFNDPIGCWHNADGDLEIVEGHGRVMALKKLGIEECPVIYLDHLTDKQRRFYTHIHNKLTDNGEFDFSILEKELASMPEFDWESFGFDMQLEFEDFDREIVNSSEEIDVENFNDDKFEHECPRCGFRFNE